MFNSSYLFDALVIYCSFSSSFRARACCARASEREWQDAHGLRTASTAGNCVDWWVARLSGFFFFFCGFHLNKYFFLLFFVFLVSDYEPKCGAGPEQTNERARTQASPSGAFKNRFGDLWCDVPVGVRGTNQDLRGKGAIALADSTLT